MKKGSWWSQLPAFVGIIAIGGFIFDSVRRDGEQARRQHQADLAARSERAAVIERGSFGEMLTLCREGWAVNDYHQPVAIAWTRRGVDAYFFQGADTSSVRQMRCDGSGATRGPRVDHPLLEQLPAEAAPDREERTNAEWPAAIAHASAQTFGPGDVAFELLLHPFTGAVLSRRWKAGPEGAAATLDPPDGAPFAFLPADSFPVVGKPPAGLRRRERKRWIAQEGAAFALLARELPKGARVSELTIDEDEIDVQIAHPTPAFEGKPPAPYGDKSFDEYGVADMDWWYPREIPGFGCAAGAPLAEVIQAFGIAKAQRGGLPITSAWYTCSTAYSNGRQGVWHLVPSSS